MLVLTTVLLWSAVVLEQEPATAPAVPLAQPAPTATPAPVAPLADPVPAAPVPAPTPTPAPPETAPPAPVRPNAERGDIVVTGRAAWEAPDPMASVNVKSYEATQAIDKAVIGPVARTYKKKVPGPFRRGIHNFLYNLREPVVFVNFFLQHKIGKAAETAGRFVINSTIGVLGVFDMAKRKPFKLPRRINGFADTLGFYGVPNGPFMYLPIVGPTTVRDLFGGAVDRVVLPLSFGAAVTDPRFAIPAGVLGALDHRAEFDETIEKLEKAPGDPYANARDFYLQRRQAEIDQLRGKRNGPIGGMSEAPVGPIRIKQRSDSLYEPVVEGAPAPAEAAPPAPSGDAARPDPAPMSAVPAAEPEPAPETPPAASPAPVPVPA